MTDLLDLIADQQATLALIAGDPLHARDRAAIVEAIGASVRPDGTVCSNDWRPLIPSWVYPRVVGATVHALIASKALEPTERYEKSTDAKGRNTGKPTKIYLWRGASCRP